MTDIFLVKEHNIVKLKSEKELKKSNEKKMRRIDFFYLMWQGPFSNCNLGERDLNFA